MLPRRFGQAVCLLIALLSIPTAAQDRAPGRQIEQLRAAVTELDLSAEQKQQLDGLFDRMGEQLSAARALRQDDPPAARRKAREIAAEMRAEMARILTPDQQQALRQRMQRQSETAPPPVPPQPPADPMRDRAAPPAQPAEESSVDSPDTRFTRAGNPLPAGTDAPPISLTDLNGRRITLDNLPRRPVVLIFGSHSCPSFRQQIPMLNQLAAAHDRRAHFLIVYTREAHAVGEWEVQRNRDQEIYVAQHQDLKARKSVAVASQRTLRIALPIGLDDMDNTTVRNYDAFPNGAVILSEDRRIIAAQRWANPFLLDEALLAISR